MAELSEIVSRFGVNPWPRDDALRRAVRELLPQADESWSLMRSERPLRRGQLVDASGRSVEFPPDPQFDEAVVVLVDPSPLMKWAHDAHWLFVSTAAPGASRLRGARLPPLEDLRFRELAWPKA